MPSILLVHGVQASRTTWWRVAADLTELGWDVRAVDLIGHGGRPGPARRPWTLDDMVADAAAQAGPVDVLLGHSLGAIVALELAAQRPDLARTVVVEDPAGIGAGGIDAVRVAADVRACSERARSDPAGYRDQILAANPLWSITDAANMVENRRRLDEEPVAEFIGAGGWDVVRQVRTCPLPVHLLMASVPRGSTLRGADRPGVLAALPAARVTAVDSGHGIHRDRPGLWLQAVVAVARG